MYLPQPVTHQNQKHKLGNADIVPERGPVVRKAVQGEKMHATEVVCVVIVAEQAGLKPEVLKLNALHATEPVNASHVKGPENVRTVTVPVNKCTISFYFLTLAADNKYTLHSQ